METIKLIFAYLLCIVGPLCTIWGGVLLNDARQKSVELKETKKLRPNVGIGYNYFDNNKIEVLIGAKKDNKEIIDDLIVTFMAAGKITKVEPNDSNIEIKPAVSFQKTPTLRESILDYVTIKCKDVLPGKLYSYVFEFQKANNAWPNDRITAVWYWKYKGKTQREETEGKRDDTWKRF